MLIVYFSVPYGLIKNGKEPAYHEVMITPTALNLRDQSKAESSRKLSADSARVIAIDHDDIIRAAWVSLLSPSPAPSPCAAGSSSELLAVSPQSAENFVELPVNEMVNGSSVSGRTTRFELSSRCLLPLGVTWQVEE